MKHTPSPRLQSILQVLTALGIIIALCASNELRAQPPRRANMIIVRVTDTANLLNRVASVLLDNQFPIINQGPGYLATGDKIPVIYPLPVRLSVRINGNQVTLTGSVESPLGGLLPILYQAGKPGKTCLTMSWHEMHKVAEGIGGEIEYVKK